MKDLDDFIALLRDEFGLSVTREDTQRGFDALPDWDSVHLLRLLTLLEQSTGQRISLPDVLEAASLADVYRLVAAA